MAKREGPLTEREKQVLRLVGEGKPNKQIAVDLEIAEDTVKAHLAKVYARLGVQNRTEAALWLERHAQEDASPAHVPDDPPPGEEIPES